MHKDFEGQYPEMEKGISWSKAAAYIWPTLRRYPVRLSAVLVLGVGVAVSEGLSIALIVPFIESLREKGSSSLATNSPIAFLMPIFEDMATNNKIRVIALMLLVFQSTKALMIYLSSRTALGLQIRIDKAQRLAVFDDLLAAGLGFIHREKLADFFTILNNFTGQVGSTTMLALAAVPLVATTTLYMAVLFMMSWQLTIIALSMATLSTFIMTGLTKRMRIYGSRVNRAAVRLNHIGFESLSSMRIIRLFAREDYVSARFEDGVRDLQRHAYAKGKTQTLVGPLYQATNVFALAMLLVVATLVLQREAEFWISLILVFMVVLFRLMGPTSGLNNTRIQIAGLLPSVHSVIEYFERQDKEYLPEGSTVFGHLHEGIRIENVSFRYIDEEAEVLSDLSFDIPKGKMTAIVGASGSGKSTLISLLSRLYDPTGGRIVVDGLDLKDYKSKTWRRKVGVVSQDTFLFNDTLRANILFGRLDATDSEIDEAARKANAHQFTMEMADGYETLLGDRGVRLSGGEAQRVAIARAMLSNPDVLILDEATSSLDTEAERVVQEAIDRATEDRTVVAVAHRLSTIRDADNIVVLEYGRVVEQGTHDELIAKQGRYWHYVRLQDLSVEERVAEAPVPSSNSDRPDQSDHPEISPVADSSSPPEGSAK